MMKEKKQTNKIYDSKVFWAVVSLILSLILWSYVSNIDGSIMDKTFSGVEVQFSGRDELISQKGLTITNVENTAVSVRLRGTRSVIAGIKASDIKAVVDVRSINQPCDISLAYDLTFQNGVDQSGITIVSKTPDTIGFSVVKNASKSVPVKGSFEGSIEEGCVAEEIVFDPETIIVEGPESILDTIDHAWVSFGKYERINASYSVDTGFELRDAEGNRVPTNELILRTDKINATQPIQKTKELPLSVNIVNGGGVTEKDCKISIEPKNISVVADSRLIDDKSSIVLGTIDLSTFKDSYEHTFTIPLEEGVDNITGVTEAVVKIEIPHVKTRTLNVSNISCKNCSDGYSAVINSEVVEVTLRSLDEAALNSVKADDITIVVDLADYGSTAGQIRANGTVFVSGISNVGAIGETKVVLTIEKD